MADFATSENTAVQAQLNRLSKLSPGGDQLGLDRVSRLLERLGRPQDALPPVFHVAGTNGKGSTCAFLRSILEAAGLNVHVFTSPHLVRFNERIRISGELIDDKALARLLAEVLDAGDGIAASFFEVTTAVAFLAFSRVPADACVIEVGLGGRLDATNVLERPLVCGISGLGIDHTQWLGRTKREIAGEKAGIAKRGAPLVTQRYPAVIARRVCEVAESADAPWIARGASWDARVMRGVIHYRDRHGAVKLPMPKLAGRHQADNAALAVAMIHHQRDITVPEAAIPAGVGTARWPARLQRLSAGPLTDLLPAGSELWVDGGHNGAAARLVAAHARANFTDGLPLTLLFASLASKDPRSMLAPFAGLVSDIRTLPLANHECIPPDELAKLAETLGLRAAASATLGEALENFASPSRVLIFGSLYLAGEALAMNRELPT